MAAKIALQALPPAVESSSIMEIRKSHLRKTSIAYKIVGGVSLDSEEAAVMNE
jgi:hypothetical protein